jgi:hypothetical protein
MEKRIRMHVTNGQFYLLANSWENVAEVKVLFLKVEAGYQTMRRRSPLILFRFEASSPRASCAFPL